VCRGSGAGHPLRCLHAHSGAPPLEAIREWKELETARDKGKGCERPKWAENATGMSAAKKLQWRIREGGVDGPRHWKRYGNGRN